MVVAVWFGVSGESGPFFAGSPPQSPDSPSPIANLDCRWCCPGPPSSPQSTRSWCTRCSRSCSSAGAVQTQTQIHPDQTRPDQTRPDPTRAKERQAGTVLRTRHRDRHKSPGAHEPMSPGTDSQTPSLLSLSHTLSLSHATLHARGRQGGSFEFGRQAFQFSAGVQPTNDTCSQPCR